MSSAWIVMDASLVIKAILPNPEQDKCRAAIASFEGKQLAVPALWMYELVSALTKAIHFGQLTADEGRAALRKMKALEVRVIVPDEAQNALAFEWTLRLKRAPAYDSFYLVVAETLGADFWTADQRLYHALQDASLPWLHWVGTSGS